MSRPEQSVRFWVWAPSDVARELAANILSSEPEDVSSEDILDAYGEMLNIVVGSVLTLVDEKGEWKMGLPHAEPVPQQTLGEAVNQTQQSISFDVEGKPLLVGWHIQDN
ncbi:MAG: chemotaxis protein CheX [Desulfarculaceae bacterium]